MDVVYFKERHSELQIKYKKEDELMWKAIKEKNAKDEKIHYGNKRFLEGQMRTLLDICEGKYGNV